MKTVITYGTFDVFHVGHLNILERLSNMGDRLVVGVSTDGFNEKKGKASLFSYEERSRIVGAIHCVDLVIPENSWGQKKEDIDRFEVDILGIGSDWEGEFDDLGAYCEVVYLPRTAEVSSTSLRERLSGISAERVEEIREGLEGLVDIVKALR